MPLNPDAVGATSEPVEIWWDSKDCLLYAVGIGAGEDDLAFSTENSIDTPQLVYPTFPVVAGAGRAGGRGGVWDKLGTFNPAMLVHGQQAVTLHRPVPVEGRADVVTTVAAMYDKGKAAVVVFDAAATSKEDGQPLWTSRMSAFIRGEGGWGGDRGPSGPINEPPAREPDHVMTYATSRQQAFIYRLSGDRNPLHTDPKFAAMGGFDRPILHGLCTYGFTGRGLLKALCDNDPARFHHIEGRFSSPVWPGDELTVNIWRTGDGEAVFTTLRNGEQTAIDQGLCRFS